MGEELKQIMKHDGTLARVSVGNVLTNKEVNCGRSLL